MRLLLFILFSISCLDSEPKVDTKDKSKWLFKYDYNQNGILDGKIKEYILELEISNNEITGKYISIKNRSIFVGEILVDTRFKDRPVMSLKQISSDYKRTVSLVFNKEKNTFTGVYYDGVGNSGDVILKKQ